MLFLGPGRLREWTDISVALLETQALTQHFLGSCQLGSTHGRGVLPLILCSRPRVVRRSIQVITHSSLVIVRSRLASPRVLLSMLVSLSSGHRYVHAFEIAVLSVDIRCITLNITVLMLLCVRIRSVFSPICLAI